MKRAATTALASLLWLACDSVGNETGQNPVQPAVVPPRLSPVEVLPPSVERNATTRVEVRDPTAVPATQLDVFRQADGVVDILWVIDDSGSMKNQRQTLGANFTRFLQELLRLNVDFQMGVVSTNTLDRGELRGTTRIIRNSTPNARAVFEANTTFPDSRNRWEQGLRSMQLALTAPNLTGVNAGLLRANAALAVIVVSDEDDHSFGDSSYYARFLRGVKGKGNENLVSFSTIAGTTPSGCYAPNEQMFYGSLADPAFRYGSVSSKTGGVVGSICDASFEDTLLRIAQALNTLRRAFPLSLLPLEDSVQVSVNGQRIARDIISGWQYRADTRSIAFLGSYVPPPGATLRIDYALSP